jgi:metal-responsive CopG/Arc/MetJ family transcriptional regulator
MPNKRNPNVVRITVTLASQMLEEMELAAKSEGTDRLELIRKALKLYLDKPRKPGAPGK